MQLSPEKLLFFLTAQICALLSFCLPAPAEVPGSPKRIVCRAELSRERREELSAELRKISGWPDLTFDNAGSLQIGRDAPTGGSQTARELLRNALVGNQVMVIEDASNRTDVVFADVLPGSWNNGRATKLPVFVVRIDFADFGHLIGDRAALAAFNPAWALLHELDHVINDAADPDTIGEAGECESLINQMRRECGLPERAEYYFTPFPESGRSEFATRLVRLAFDSATKNAKHRRYWVIWDAALVGGRDPAKQTASLR